MPKIIAQDVLDHAKRAYEAHGCNLTEAAKSLKWSRTTLQTRLRIAGVKRKPGTHGGRNMPGPRRKSHAEPAKTRVVLMTAAQDDTPLHEGAIRNLRAYAAHRGAEIFVGPFTYDKTLFTDHETKNGKFHKDVREYLRPDIVQLAPNLVWWGDFNVLPTASDPLQGWDTQSKGNWAVFPHAKIALKCVPTMPGRFGKQIMTTGVLTIPNYIKKNAGQKAEFHHTQGATVAEIRPDGTFFCRQLSMGKDGGFQDLDLIVRDGKVSEGPPVAAITWGDIHLEVLDAEVARVLWGFDPTSGNNLTESNMLDDLKPQHQFFHDSFDFKSRSHHTRNDPHERAMRLIEGQDSVEEMLDRTARFLAATQREWSKSVHVASNHNAHLHRWMKDPLAHMDAANAYIWHRLNAEYHGAIREGDLAFQPHIWALRNRGWDLDSMAFLKEGDSFQICTGTQPVECGLHGDRGPRGVRGSAHGFAKIVERVNTGHTHEPRIVESAYVAGTSCRLDIPYATRGPTTWHQAEIVTYRSGKRTIVTLQNGAYRA